MEAPLMHLALVGTPNSGKTSLFNALTGSRQKVANYPGVTVERKEGSFVTPTGRQVSLVDLPGTYSLRGRSPDEEITRDVVLGSTPGEAAARSRAVRRRLHQSAPDDPPGARTQAHRPAADAGAQHVRHRHPPRRHRRRAAACPRRSASPWSHRSRCARAAPQTCCAGPTRSSRRKRPAPYSQICGNRSTIAQLRATQREADRIIAATVSLPTRPDTWTARIDAVVLHPVAGLAILALILFVMFQAVFAWAQPLMELLASDLRRARRTGSRHTARRPPAELPAERRDIRRRQRHRVPAADHHHLPVHPAAGRFRLHGTRRVPDGPHHGRRRPARPRLHPAAVELRLRHPRHHGDAGDRQPPRPADHHPDRAADDLFGADPGLHADHLGLHPRPAGLGFCQFAGPCNVRPLRGGHRQRARPVVPDQVLHVARLRAGAVHAGTAGLQDAAAAQHRDRHLHPRQDVPAARRHHDLFDDGADLVPGVVPATAGRRHRARHQLQPRRHDRQGAGAVARPASASTGRSRWR